MFHSMFSRGAALVALVAAGGLLMLACGGEEAVKTPTPSGTGAVQRTATGSPAAGGASTAAKLPILNAVPNAPPRATPSPLPPGQTPTPPPPRPTPPPAKVSQVSFYVDTVTAGPGESKYNVDADRFCARTSTFRRGMHIVWRMKLSDNTGKELQVADVATAVLKLPNGEDVTFNFGRHGATDDSPWFWTAAWDAPPTFPLGVVDYSINVTTKDGKSGTFKEIPVSGAGGIESRLQVIE